MSPAAARAPLWENDSVVGYFPRQHELPGVEFNAEQEIKDCAKLAERVREEARDAMMVARFRELARKRLNEENRDADDPDALGLAVARERKVWTRTRLTDLGVERSAWWGWPNIYTYTKSLGETAGSPLKPASCAASSGQVLSNRRWPTPFPGWNEGFTTTAPIIFLVLKGQTQLPANDKLILDITPVDQVASVMLAVTAQACVEEPALVHQAATGDSNPANMDRIIGLVGLYKRRHFKEKETGVKLLNEIVARMEPRPVPMSTFEKRSVPMFNAAAKRASSLLDRARPRWGGGRAGDVIDRMKSTVDRVQEITQKRLKRLRCFGRSPSTTPTSFARTTCARCLLASEKMNRTAALAPGKV